MINKLAVILVLGVLGAGCSDHDVMRVIELSPSTLLPSASADVHDGELTVVSTGLEALSEGRYVLWLDSGDGWLALGELDEELSVAVALPEGTTSGSLRVTEEAAGNELPEEPSDLLRLQGDETGLSFVASFDAAAIPQATGEATLTDDTVVATMNGLPRAPEGMFYGFWVVWDAPVHDDGGHDDDTDDGSTDDSDAESEDDGHAHKSGDHDEEAEVPDVAEESDGHDDEAMEAPSYERMALIGHVTPQGEIRRIHSEMIANCQQVLVTLESDLGVAGASPFIVLSGQVTVPEGSAGGHADSAHMH